MTTIHRHTGAAHAHAVTSSAHDAAAHKSAHVDLRARLWRSSLFRHSAHPWHPAHAAPHAYLGALEHLVHHAAHAGAHPGSHAGSHPGSHPLARHDAHGNRQHRDPNGNPRHRQAEQQAKNASQRHAKPGTQQQQNKHQQHKQQQQQPRHPKPGAQAPRRMPQAAHPAHAPHRSYGSWSTRREPPVPGSAQARDVNALAASGDGDGDGGNRNGGQRDATPDRARRIGAIARVAATARAELQALAASTADRPFVYAQSMREAVIRQRCAGHDPLTVALDVLKARQLAHDDSRSSYDDLQGFLADFKRLSAGSGARGALTPLLAFHDLRASTPSLRLRSLTVLGALGLARAVRAGSAGSPASNEAAKSSR